LTQAAISNKIGYGAWWASGVRTKGDGVTDEALDKLRNLADKKLKVAHSNGRKKNAARSKTRSFILSMFPDNSVSLSKAFIMQRGLEKGLSCGAIELTIYAMKANGELTSPTRGDYKLPAIAKTNGNHNNGNGNVTVNARSFKRLMKDVRIIKKFIRKQNA
jgi:hypothetical protein